jgi:hypothetical protein
MAFKRNKSQQTYFRTTNSFIGESVLLFIIFFTLKGALDKEKSKDINLCKTSDCVRDKSNFENRVAIRFAFDE